MPRHCRRIRCQQVMCALLVVAAIFGLFQGGTPSASAASDDRLCELYLQVMEDAVDVFDPLWREDPHIPNAGFFDFRQYGNWTDDAYASVIVIPGTGMVLLDYAVLLTETDKDVFGKRELPRDLLRQRVVRAIRWCCLTSAYVDNPRAYLPDMPSNYRAGEQWKRLAGVRADLIGYLTLAVALLSNDLDSETRALFRAVAEGGAVRSRIPRTWAPPQGGNHDQVKQDLSSTFGAAYLFDAAGDSSAFFDRVIESGIDMVGTRLDRTKTVRAEGKPVREWARGWHLYEDYSSDHHGHANIWYGGDLLFEGRSYIDIAAHHTGKRVPETFTYQGNAFDGVLQWLKILCLAEGGLAHPHGAEYDSYYGAGLLAFCYGATVKKDRVAAALELQAAKLLSRHTRAVREYDYHRGSWAKAAMAYLMHKFHGPAAAPMELSEAIGSLEGTYHYREQRCLVHRTPQRWTSFSWGSTTYEPETDRPNPRWPAGARGLCGAIAPQDLDQVDSTPLVYYHPHSLSGEIRDHSFLFAATTVGRWVHGVALRSKRRRQCSAVAAGVLALAICAFLAIKRLRHPWVLRVGGAMATGSLVVCCVFIVQTARKGTPPEITDIQYKFHRSDDSFSTAGQATCGGVRRQQAFFSFAGGPCVNLVALRGLKRTEISWTGLPVHFFVRSGLSADHVCRFEDDSKPIGELGEIESASWCVDGRLGAVTVGGNGQIRGTRTAGYNWARKPSYRDKVDVIAMSPLDRVDVESGGTVADLGNVFYVNQPYEYVQQCAADVQDLSPELPRGWKGLVAPLGSDAKARVLAVANLSEKEATARLRLSFPEGAPILTENTLICNNVATAKIRLSALETLADTIRWYVEVSEGETVRARRLQGDRLELTSLKNMDSTARVKYFGSDGERILLKDKTGQTIKEVPLAIAADGFPCRVHEYLQIELHGHQAADTMGPAVEIAAVESRPDGSLGVTVLAEDRSGIQSVDLYCNDELISQKLEGPFRWTCKPGNGWHTFRAVAKDASPGGNVSNSVTWTRQVESPSK